MPVEHCNTIDKIADFIPDIVNKVNEFITKKEEQTKEEKSEIKQEIKTKPEVKEVEHIYTDKIDEDE